MLTVAHLFTGSVPYDMKTPTPLLFSLFCLFGFSCGGGVQVVPAGGLDYTELADPTGWRLRVYGNGSGSISHAQLPAYHLHYPRSTFPAAHLSRLRSDRESCIVRAESYDCTRLTRYSAVSDSAYHCPCTNTIWVEELMLVAINRMDSAVDAGESERSCRMLKRQWLLR